MRQILYRVASSYAYRVASSFAYRVASSFAYRVASSFAYRVASSFAYTTANHFFTTIFSFTSRSACQFPTTPNTPALRQQPNLNWGNYIFKQTWYSSFLFHARPNKIVAQVYLRMHLPSLFFFFGATVH
ncbi:MAG: hypothetical protein UT38_C0014G0010 [Microgenomates group bacterium GW2011_GWA2_39_19]|nr:MAG: hypothetical protein UT38_C0014G0010 [Microgenomates group bacterium GW2011_GWA2_39_19]